MASGPAIVAAASRQGARARQLGLAGMVVVDLRVIGTSAAVVVCARIATAAHTRAPHNDSPNTVLRMHDVLPSCSCHMQAPSCDRGHGEPARRAARLGAGGPPRWPSSSPRAVVPAITARSTSCSPTSAAPRWRRRSPLRGRGLGSTRPSSSRVTPTSRCRRAWSRWPTSRWRRASPRRSPSPWSTLSAWAPGRSWSGWRISPSSRRTRGGRSPPAPRRSRSPRTRGGATPGPPGTTRLGLAPGHGGRGRSRFDAGAA